MKLKQKNIWQFNNKFENDEKEENDFILNYNLLHENYIHHLL